MKNKKLMILIWNMGVGGIQKRVRDIVLEISKKESRGEVYMLVKHKNPDYFSEALKQCPGVTFKYFEGKGFVSGLIWVIKEYLEIKPDTCLTFLDHFSVMMVWIGRIFFWQKTKIVLNEGILTSKYLELYRKESIGLWSFLIRISYRWADKVIVPAKSCERDLIKNFGVPKKKIRVIHNWTLYESGNTSGKTDLIYAGRFDEDKRVIDFVEIIEKLKLIYPKIKLVMLGEGNVDKVLRKLVQTKKLQKNIFIVGFSDKVRKYLCESKIFVLPSINEGLPNVVLEAAMCGVPTVSNKFVGVDEVVMDKKTGFVTESVDEMVDKIKILLGNEKKRKIMGDEAKKFVEKRFGKNNQDKFIRELYN